MKVRQGDGSTGGSAYGVFLAAGLVVMWSSGYIGAKIASAAGSVLLILFWRFLLLALVLAPFVVREFSKSGWRPLAINAALGLFAMSINIVCGVVAIDKGMPAGTLAIIYSLQPLATAALTGPLLREAVTGRQWLGLLVAFAGVVFASGFDGSCAAPIVYALAAAGMFGLVIGMLIGKAFPVSTPLLPSIGVQCAVTALFLLPLVLQGDHILPPIGDPMFLASIAWFMLFSTIGAYTFFLFCLRYFTATQVGAILYISPPFTIFVAWLAFGEPVPVAKIVGLCICLAGVAIAMRSAANAR
ncbi:MAG: DMT family transporter [Hyphomicrobiales bacterium]